MSEKRKMDKKQIPTCNIMGVNIAAINMKWLVDFTTTYIKELSGNYMCVSNVHTTVTAFENVEYRKIQNSGIMAIPDGGPLTFIGKRCGYAFMERTTGPDYMDEIMKISAAKGYRHFFYGSTEKTLQKLYKNIKTCYPDLKIVGMYSPPFRTLSLEEDEQVIKQITDAYPDFIWIGLGAPRQEQWMYNHQAKIPGFMIGVGAAFDYFAGNIKRAPKWMQTSNLEWLYRLLQDPGRLFTRYLYTNTKFIWHTVLKKQK